jgi:hypothetical protein
MCKEMPVIPVNRVVDKKERWEKMEGHGGGEAQWVADPYNPQHFFFMPWWRGLMVIYDWE